MRRVREFDLDAVGQSDVSAKDRAELIGSCPVLELAGHDSVKAAFPNAQADLVAAEVEDLALEIPTPGPLSFVVARRPHRPGWTTVTLAVRDPDRSHPPY